eukprot:10173764-Alexandrium_andersonii.AAC.1
MPGGMLPRWLLRSLRTLALVTIFACVGPPIAVVDAVDVALHFARVPAWARQRVLLGTACAVALLT